VRMTDELRALCATYPDHAEFFQACADKLDEARRWKQAWIETEIKNEQLTRELEVLRLNR
jgi:hypothetical protein